MWSPQHYRTSGKRNGSSDELIARASAATETFIDSHPKLPVLLTLGHLAHRSGVSWYWLRKYVEGSRKEAYSHFRIRKRSGGHRVISVPEDNLKTVQRWITEYILAELPVHRASFAFARGSSIVACAKQHCNARWVMKMDISGFFGSIGAIKVYRVFLDAGYSPLVAFELARLCTHAPTSSARYSDRVWLNRGSKGSDYPYRQPWIGYLPQGAPTSPMLSNLVMIETDKRLAKIASAAGLTYTRYSDDITYSNTGNFDRGKALNVIRQTAAVLRSEGFRINEKKTKIVPPGARKVVLGLLVDGDEPKLTKEFRDLVRQHLYYLETRGPEAHRRLRNFDTVAGLHRHLRGLIDFSKAVDANFSDLMRAKFDSIAWSLDVAKSDDDAGKQDT